MSFKEAKRGRIIAKRRAGQDDLSFDIHQTHLDRKTHQAGDVVNVQTLHQLGAVGLDSLGADI